MPYKRVLLKISGEALMGSSPFGVEQEATSRLAHGIAELQRGGHEVGIVMGGGNIFRGIQNGPLLGLERSAADSIGMLATLINGTALAEGLRKAGCHPILLSAIECPLIADSYRWDKAMEALSSGRIVLFVGGTGHPYFTTDTAAALRASEIKADLLLKATTKVDGVYDKDPLVHKEAKKYDRLSYGEVVEKRLGVMDLSAVVLCMTNRIPMGVFNFTRHSLLEAVSSTGVGTIIS